MSSEVTTPLTLRIDTAAAGDSEAANQLLPLHYDELRWLTAALLAHEHR